MGKASLPEIYKTPPASYCPFLTHPGLEQSLMLSFILLHHIPVLAENSFYFLPQQLRQLYQGAVLPRTARNSFSRQTPLLTHGANKHFTANTSTTEVHRTFGKHPREQHIGSCIPILCCLYAPTTSKSLCRCSNIDAQAASTPGACAYHSPTLNQYVH